MLKKDFLRGEFWKVHVLKNNALLSKYYFKTRVKIFNLYILILNFYFYF